MRQRLAVLLVVTLTFACSDGRVDPTGPDLSAAAPEAAQRYIVVFQDDAGPAAALAASIARDWGLTPAFVYRHALRGFAAALPDAARQGLERDPRVKYLARDDTVRIVGTQSPVPSWGLDRIDMRSLPLDGSYTYATTGAGVTLYGIDTGIRASHQDFGGRVSGGFTAVLDGRGTDDCNGHGTHTASTAAGAAYGVAKDMAVVPVRVLDCDGSGLISQVVAGVDWVTGNATLPAVANMSLGGFYNQALNDAVAASVGAGVFYSVAAGNYNFDTCFFSPASEPSALTVAATAANDQRASFSNTGSCVDIFAPGVGITAAWSTSDAATNTISGTSMSAPHAAGAAGLYLEANAGATPAQVSAALLANGTPGVVGNPGSGSPNLLLYMGFIAPSVNQPPVATFTAACENATGAINCTADGRGSSDDQGIVSYVWTNALGTVVGTDPTISRTLSGPWTGYITLTVTDAAGLSDSYTGLVDGTPPVAFYTFTCDANRFCTADGTYSFDDQGIVSYVWTIYDKVYGTEPILSGPAKTTLAFPLTLTVTDASGLTGSRTYTLRVP
jgi:subtilisin family serine protease